MFLKNLKFYVSTATMDSAVKKLAYRYMNDPSVISIKSKEVTLDNIIQEVVETTDRNKQDSLLKCLDKDNPFFIYNIL
mgnify:CR=1 FL=1